MIRVLHFSDLHLEDGFAGEPTGAFLNKRLVGLLNLKLRRAAHFRGAREKVEALAAFAEREAIDLALCTGDYTALGTESELAFARGVIDPFTKAPRGFVTLAGNHDLYVEDTVLAGRFERHFGAFLHTERPELSVDGRFPIVRFPADGVAVVALESSRVNPAPHVSSGRVPDAQIEALERILALPELEDRFVFVMTHYAPRLWNGRPDSTLHGLENADALLRALRGLRFGALLFGHVHHRYHLHEAEHSVPLFCAGSATYRDREGAWLFELGEETAVAMPLGFERGEWVAERGKAIALRPRGPGASLTP
ncbi:MAG: metallophosphoesterase [Polyangiales bacterium]